jgi:hypothetical protein
MSIVKDCMIVNLQIGTWTGYRLDKEASSAVTSQAGAHADAARVNKHLIPREMLKPIVSASNAIRTHFYGQTLPWKDNGDRLLTRKMYMRFIDQHGALKQQFADAVEQFLTRDYGLARDQAMFRMGRLFNRDDYPGVRDLQGRFYVHVDIDPVTEAGDFRVELDAAHLDAVRRDIEEATRARLGKAMADVWGRLSETLGHFANKMGSEEVFRNSTVNNLREIVEILPDLNVIDDVNLDRIREDIDRHLLGYSPDDLRKIPEVRHAAATDAKRILDNMAGFMRAFDGMKTAA